MPCSVTARALKEKGKLAEKADPFKRLSSGFQGNHESSSYLHIQHTSGVSELWLAGVMNALCKTNVKIMLKD